MAFFLATEISLFHNIQGVEKKQLIFMKCDAEWITNEQRPFWQPKFTEILSCLGGFLVVLFFVVYSVLKRSN